MSPYLAQPIPIKTVVDGVEVRGAITFLQPNDMSVVIQSPVSGLETSVHMPHYAMYPCNYLTKHDATKNIGAPALTERGKECSVWLLRELYDHVCGHGSGWGIARIEADGQRIDIVPPPGPPSLERA